MILILLIPAVTLSTRRQLLPWRQCRSWLTDRSPSSGAFTFIFPLSESLFARLKLVKLLWRYTQPGCVSISSVTHPPHLRTDGRIRQKCVNTFLDKSLLHRFKVRARPLCLRLSVRPPVVALSMSACVSVFLHVFWSVSGCPCWIFANLYTPIRSSASVCYICSIQTSQSCMLNVWVVCAFL